MSTISTTVALTDAALLIEQLDALQPNRLQLNESMFQKLYPGIERAISRKVSQKEIVAKLGTMGLRLSMGGFRSLLEAERRQHQERGEYLRCVHCNAILPSVSQTGSTECQDSAIAEQTGTRQRPSLARAYLDSGNLVQKRAEHGK